MFLLDKPAYCGNNNSWRLSKLYLTGNKGPTVNKSAGFIILSLASLHCPYRSTYQPELETVVIVAICWPYRKQEHKRLWYFSRCASLLAASLRVNIDLTR